MKRRSVCALCRGYSTANAPRRGKRVAFIQSLAQELGVKKVFQLPLMNGDSAVQQCVCLIYWFSPRIGTLNR